MVPLGKNSRYLTDKVTSVNFKVIPKKPAIIIQNAAPAPPMEMAIETAAILPIPTVAESAVASDWNGEITPLSSFVWYFPLTMLKE